MLDSSIPYRIQRIYTSCTDKEKYYLRKILEEISETGDSQTYRDIWLTDYKEIPVDIDTFLCDNYYLGKTNRNGQAVYPYWKNFMQKLFYSGNKYEEVFFTGATRIGKSSTAITCTAYMLYKLMCLRDPQQYFGKKDVSVFSILFFNLTKELAAGVGYREFQDTVLASPWFLDNGKQAGSAKNPYYIPDGGKVTIDYGSDAAHGLGKQVFCLVGDTEVLTSTGYQKIEDICGQTVDVAQYGDFEVLYSPASVYLTKYADTTIRIELEDGSILEGTPDHKVLLSDGTYKELGKLTNSDDLLTLNNVEVDQMNLTDRNKTFTVYKHTTPSNKVYIGITCESVDKRWGKNGSGYHDNMHFWSAIQKYGWDNIVHEILFTDLSIDEASKKEIELIAKYESSDPKYGYNKTLGGEVGFPSEETREKLRQARRKLASDPEYIEKVRRSLTGHFVSEETKQRISQANRGRKHLKPSRLKGVHLSESHKMKLRGKPSWIKGHTKYTHPSVMKISEKKLGVPKSDSTKQRIRESALRRYRESEFDPIWVNNGEKEILLDISSKEIPEGFSRGRLDLDFVYIHKQDTDEEIKISKDCLDQYLYQGWILGPSKRRCNSISKSRQVFVWMYNDIKFNTSVELAEYLRSHGYPKIVGSTITSLYSKGFKNSRMYADLQDKITREEVHHENKID